jgi:hypothetical protein
MKILFSSLAIFVGKRAEKDEFAGRSGNVHLTHASLLELGRFTARGTNAMF